MGALTQSFIAPGHFRATNVALPWFLDRFTVRLPVIRLSHSTRCKPKKDAPLWIALQQSATRFNAAMCLLVAALFLFDVVLARRVKLDGLSQIASAWPGFLLVAVTLSLCHWYPLPRLIASCENVIWTILLTHLLSVVIQIAARSPWPLVDAQLHEIDQYLHLSTVDIVHASAHIPMLNAVLSTTYSLVSLMIIAALILPPFVGRPEASRRYLVAIVLATFVTASLFALWPAAGPWVMEGFKPSPAQRQVTQYLTLLKSHGRVTLDFDAAAIVSFPSFHVVLAILSATALTGIPRARFAAWVIAGLTCVSTLTTGWHYGIDLLGGFAVALIAQTAAVPICQALEDRQGPFLAHLQSRSKRLESAPLPDAAYPGTELA